MTAGIAAVNDRRNFQYTNALGALDVSGSAIDSSFVPPPTSPRLRILDDVGHRCCQKLSEWLPFQRAILKNLRCMVSESPGPMKSAIAKATRWSEEVRSNP